MINSDSARFWGKVAATHTANQTVELEDLLFPDAQTTLDALAGGETDLWFVYRLEDATLLTSYRGPTLRELSKLGAKQVGSFGISRKAALSIRDLALVYYEVRIPCRECSGFDMTPAGGEIADYQFTDIASSICVTCQQPSEVICRLPNNFIVDTWLDWHEEYPPRNYIREGQISALEFLRRSRS